MAWLLDNNQFVIKAEFNAAQVGILDCQQVGRLKTFSIALLLVARAIVRVVMLPFASLLMGGHKSAGSVRKLLQMSWLDLKESWQLFTVSFEPVSKREIANAELLCCPILCQPFQDPVILLTDGQTYERTCLERWFEKNLSSPITRERTDGVFYPHLMVKELNPVCPITKKPFEVAFYCVETQCSYEKQAIEKWHEAHLNGLGGYWTAPDGKTYGSFRIYPDFILGENKVKNPTNK